MTKEERRQDLVTVNELFSRPIKAALCRTRAHEGPMMQCRESDVVQDSKVIHGPVL